MENNNNLEAHYKSLQPHDYLGACDVEPTKQDRENGVKITATIDTIKQEEVIDISKIKEKNNKKICITCYFKEANLKPMILNKTNQTAIAKVSESPYVNDWAGVKITIYVKHNISAFGKKTDGLRIQDYAPVDKLICEQCGDIIQKFKQYETAEAVAEYTYNKYGSQLCVKCAKERTALLEGNDE